MQYQVNTQIVDTLKRGVELAIENNVNKVEVIGHPDFGRVGVMLGKPVNVNVKSIKKTLATYQKELVKHEKW